jgi:hypothetical protein
MLNDRIQDFKSRFQRIKKNLAHSREQVNIQPTIKEVIRGIWLNL